MARTGGWSECTRWGTPRSVRTGGTDRVNAASLAARGAGIPSMETVEGDRVWIGRDCSGATLQHEEVSIRAVDPALAEGVSESPPMQQACAWDPEDIAQR